jgi:uncharacterized protein with HEPN domain
MPERSSPLLLQDILDAIGAIREYTKDMSFEDFLADRRTRDAVLHNIQGIGEAAKRVPQDVKDTYPEVEWIEWMRIIRSRHILVHDDFGVDYEIVWRIVDVHLHPLEAAITIILANTSTDTST